MKFELKLYSQFNRIFVRRPVWHKATDDNLLRYRKETSTQLQDTALPVDALLRRNVFCNDPIHSRYCWIEIIIISAGSALPPAS
jgi:hypothetical protein